MGIDARMYVITDYQFTDEELQLWNYRIGAVLGVHSKSGPIWVTREYGGRRALERSDTLPSYYDNEEQAREEGWVPDTIQQDHIDNSLDVHAASNERMLKVSLFTRYYGIGYERGDLIGLIATAEWLERNIPNARVYYGGDSSGVIIDPWTKEKREELLAHWAQMGHEPYNSAFDNDHGSTRMERPICDFCGVPTMRFGWGGNYAAFGCAGCGLSIVTEDNGLSYFHHDGFGKDTERKPWTPAAVVNKV